ncbi:hypothetical protein ABZ747_09205 [Kitasatospora cineracea]|uniref:hypothetical protein n=1 Tax=Kitasatospora cineracea TaxID=88074 RepID=UPI0033D06DF0
MNSYLRMWAGRITDFNAAPNSAARARLMAQWGVETVEEVAYWSTQVEEQRRARAAAAQLACCAEGEAAQPSDDADGRVVQLRPRRSSTPGAPRGKRRPETPVPSGGPGRRGRAEPTTPPVTTDMPRRFVVTITITVES